MPETFKHMPPTKYAEMLASLSGVKANAYFEKSLKNLSRGGDGSDHMHFSPALVLVFTRVSNSFNG